MAARSERSASPSLAPKTTPRWGIVWLPVVALAVSAVVMVVLWQRAEHRARDEEEKVRLAKTQEDAVRKIKQDLEGEVERLKHQAAPSPSNPGSLSRAAGAGALSLLQDRLLHQLQTERAWEWHYFHQRLRSEGFLLQAHVKHLTVFTFRPPEGKEAASGCANGLVVLWDADAADEAKPRILKGLDGPVTALAFSKDGRVLAAGGEAGALLAWTLDDPQAKPHKLPGHKDRIAALAFDPKSHVLASAAGIDVRFWDLNPDAKKESAAPLELTVLPPQPAAIHDLAFTPDGDRILTACHDHKVRIWDWLKGKELKTPLEMTHWATAVAVQPDGQFIASASLDGAVKVWDSGTGKEVLTLESAPMPIKSLAYSGDKKRLAGLGLDHTILSWDLKTLKLVKMIPPQEGRLRGPWFSFDGDQFPSILCQGTEPELDRRTAPTALLGVAFGPKDQELGAVGADGSLFLWEVQAKDKQETLKSSIKAHTGAVPALAFSAARGQWATAGEDGQIGLWEFGKNENIVKDPAKAAILAVAYEPKGQLLATAGRDQAIKVWDPANAGTLRSFTGGHTDAVLSVTFSPGGDLLASGGADHTLILWNVAKGEPTDFKGKHHGPVTAVAFAPKAKLLASAGRDRVIRIWDLETGKEKTTCAGHAQALTCLAFSPDGLRLASGSDDHTVKLWDVATGQEVLTLTGHQQGVTGVAFSSDGLGLASVSWDQTLILWNAPGAGKTQK